VSEERELDRIGGVCAMLGVAVGVAAAMLGPMDLDSHDIQAVLQAFAARSGRMHLHGLGVSVGTLLILGGFVALQRSLHGGTAGALARLGLAAAVVMTVIHLLGAMMGGSVLPALAELHALDPAGEAAGALWVGQGFYVLYESLLAPTFLTLAATVLLFSTAFLWSIHYPAWLGWAGIIAGVWTAAGALAFVFAGPIEAADIMLRFIPGFMLCMAWVFTVGFLLWRPRTREREPSPGGPMSATR
jgi:hypothetical protein